jgi:hypothetical protein
MKSPRLACLLTLLLSVFVLAQSDGAPLANQKNESPTAQRLNPTLPPNPSQTSKGEIPPQRKASLTQNGLNFAPAVEYPSGGSGAFSVAVTDVNRDGKPDLLVANCATSGNCSDNLSVVGVILGNGDGTFQPVVTYVSGGAYAESLAAADVNGDGKPDMVVGIACNTDDCTNNAALVGVLLGNGDGTFQPVVTYGAGGIGGCCGPQPVTVADVNGDGKPDLLVASCSSAPPNCTNGSVVGVLLGNGDGTFQTTVTYNSGGYFAHSVVVADVNGDGTPDIIVANYCASNNNCSGAVVPGVVGVLLGNGDGTFQPVTTYASGGIWTASAAVADVNGDGKPDLVIASSCVNVSCNPQGGGVSVLLGNGNGTFQAAVTYSSGGGGSYSVAVADVNGDGKPDLVVANEGGNVGVLLGNGDGTFQTAVTYSPGQFPDPRSVSVADVNGDGKPDLVVANEGAPSEGTVGVLINTSLGSTTTALTSSLNPSNFDQPVTFTAMVTSSQFFNFQPTGTVSFLDGATSIGNSNLNGSGVATLTTSTLSVGTRSITATYNGDANFSSSTSPVLYQVVGAIVAFSPSGLNFGNQTVGITSPPLMTTLTNVGNVALTVTSIVVTGANSSAFGQMNNCPASIPPSGSCTISVTFSPTMVHSYSASLTITDSAHGSPQIVPLTGTGNGPILTVSPPNLTFPNQYVGTSGLPQTVTLTNTGDGALTITSATTSTGDFGSLNACGSGLAPGASCAVGVFFDPTVGGTRNGSLAIADNAAGSPQMVGLTGVGQDFSMTSSGSSTASVSPGGTATYALTVAPAGGFKQTVAFTCSGAPAGFVCSVPSSVTLNGSTPTKVTVTVTTAASSGNLVQPGGVSPIDGRLATWLVLSGLPGLVVLGRSSARRRHRSRRLWLGFACLLFLGITWTACGGGGSMGSGTSYNLTVTGSFSSGTAKLTHNTNLTLVVQ